MAWLIYALGGGWGHLVRAVAISKVLDPSIPVHILTNSPHWQKIRVYTQNFPWMSIHAVTKSNIHDFSNYWQSLFRKYQFQLLIVDTFPRGLMGELVDNLPRTIPKILLARDLHPEYVAKFNLATFIQANYDLVIPVEPVDYLGIEPVQGKIVICNPQELIPASQARQILGLANTKKPIVLVCPSGNPQEVAWFREQSLYWQNQFPNYYFLTADYFPLMYLYLAIDAVIGSGGYNTIAECVSLNIPLFAVALPRLYDRQALRIQRHLEQQVYPLSAFPRDLVPKQKNATFRNGAIAVPELIRKHF
ncbi:MAG: hypothetical protein ACK4QL_02710 [Pseudanabaenaceae cyanobacterium]